jgi:hypothetical protein
MMDQKEYGKPVKRYNKGNAQSQSDNKGKDLHAKVRIFEELDQDPVYNKNEEYIGNRTEQ